LPIRRAKILRIHYSCAVSPSSISIASGVEKNMYKPWWNSPALTVCGAAGTPKEVRINDRPVQDWRFDGQAHTVALTVPEGVNNWSVRIAF